MNFAHQYLKVSSFSLPTSGEDNPTSRSDTDKPTSEEEIKWFCEPCSRNVTIICDLYKELCAIELHLSSKLEKLGGLIKKSKKIVAGSEYEELENSQVIKALAVQLGTGTKSVCDLRYAILFKCFHQCETIAKKNRERLEDIEVNVKNEVEGLDYNQEEGYHDDVDNDAKSDSEFSLTSFCDDRNSGSDSDYSDRDRVALDTNVRGGGSRRRSNRHSILLKEGETPETGHSQAKDVIERKTTSEDENASSDSDFSFALSSDDDNDNSNSDSGGSECSDGMVSEDEDEKIPHRPLAAKSKGGTANYSHSCQLCNKKYSTVVTLFKHLMRTHEKDSNKKQLYCYFCSHSFSHDHSRIVHISLKHPTDKIICEDGRCAATFQHSAQLSDHLLKSHSKQPAHQCSKCELGFFHPEVLKLHKVLHTKSVDKKYPCPVLECGTNCSNPMSLHFHYNTKHGIQLGSYNCPKCELRLTSKTVLLSHLKKHESLKEPIQEGTYQIAPPPCSVCGLQFMSQKALDKHRKTDHQLGIVCLDCGKPVSNRNSLARHRKLRHNPNGNSDSFKCPQCELSFPIKEYLPRHILLKHHISSPTEQKGKFGCSYCPLKFRWRHILTSHLRRCEKNPTRRAPKSKKGAYPCPHCSKVFCLRSKVNLHVPACRKNPNKVQRRRRINKLSRRKPTSEKNQNRRKRIKIIPKPKPKNDEGIKSSTKVQKLYCCFCNLSFVHQLSRDAHTSLIHPTQSLSCDDENCEACFVHPLQLNEHLTTSHHSKPVYYCSKCEVGFIQYERLSEHQKIHSNNGDLPLSTTLPPPLRSHPCNICGRVFEDIRKFRAHLTTHPKETWVETCACEFCEESFPDQEILRRHKSYKHSSNKITYMCDLCGKVCMTKSNLDTHRASHAGEKRFACHLCPALYTVNYSLKNHLRRHHGKLEGEEFTSGEGQLSNKWKCQTPSCNQSFSDETQLKCHVEQEHFGAANNSSDGPNANMCKLCGRVFANQQRLQRHSAVHSKVKLYKCHICQKGLSQPNALKDHLLGIHGEGKTVDIRCKEKGCEKRKFKYYTYFYKHLRDRHGIYVSRARKSGGVGPGNVGTNTSQN